MINNLYIRDGILKETGDIILQKTSPGKACIVTDSNVDALYSDKVISSVASKGFEVVRLVFEPGEKTKCYQNIGKIVNTLLANDFGRKDILIALGGGVIGDLTGFAASVYMRGIPYYQIPTSLTGQIDSAIGGKTGIDYGIYKNILGAFYLPEAVIIDTSLTSTLPLRFLRDGMAELVKYSLLMGGELYQKMKDLKCAEDFYKDSEYYISTCAMYKKELTEKDIFDKGLRMLLNLGHTMGHCIEGYYNYERYTHGEGVAIGMCEILRYSVQKGLTKERYYTEMENILNNIGLPTVLEAPRKEVYAKIGNDKKGEGDRINLIIPITPGDVRIIKTEKSILKEW